MFVRRNAPPSPPENVPPVEARAATQSSRRPSGFVFLLARECGVHQAGYGWNAAILTRAENSPAVEEDGEGSQPGRVGNLKEESCDDKSVCDVALRGQDSWSA